MSVMEMRGSLQVLFVIALAIVSWRPGAAPERSTVAILFLMAAGAWLYRYISMPVLPGRIFGGYFDTNPVFVLIDGLSLLGFMAIALFANRMYPMWIAGFQLTAFGMHFVNEAARTKTPFAYALLNIVPYYFMIVSYLAGMIFHMRRKRRWGPYPSWRSF